MASKQVIQYRAKIKELLADVGNLKQDGVKRALKLLEDARKQTIANLQDAVAGEWKAHHLNQLKRATEGAVSRFSRQYGVDLQSRENGIWNLGREFVDGPLDIMDVSAVIPEIDLAALEIAQAGTADLVTGLTADLASKINTQIQLGLLGQKSPYEIMQAIGKNITDPGPFKTIAGRAETIMRTELGRVQSLATHARMEQAGRVVPGMMHQWLWSGIGRVEHALAHGQTRKVGKPYDVGGEKLMYPLDPAGSPKNTVNCGCSEVITMEGWPDIKELNPDLARKAERRLAA